MAIQELKEKKRLSELTTERIIKEGIKALDEIATESTTLKGFLEGAAKKYPNFEDLKIMMSKWLKISNSDQEEYFLSVIDTSAESISRKNVKKLFWKDADKSDKALWFKETLSQQIYKKAQEIGIQMLPLDFIFEIAKYDPRVTEKEQKINCKEPKRLKRSKTDTKTTGEKKNSSCWEELTQQQKDDAAAQEAIAKKLAKEKYKDEEEKIAIIRGKVSNTEDIDTLNKLLKQLQPYLNGHELSTGMIVREIESKIASISSETIRSISTDGDIKSRILADLSVGTLDVKQAINNIEQAAKEACEGITGDNEKRTKLGVRITPRGYTSKILMDIIISIEKGYPIAEAIEDKVILQLVQLGVSLQQATRAIVVNLINSQDYRRAQNLIERYPKAERKAKEKNAQRYDAEATKKVVENWNGMIITAQRVSSTKSEVKPQEERS